MKAAVSRKRHSPEFKDRVVLQLLEGKARAAALSRMQGVQVQVLHGWRR